MPVPKSNKPRGGFASHKKKARNNMDVRDILVTATEPLITSLTFHAALLGACYIQTVNRARNGIKFIVKYGEDDIGEWANTPEEAIEVLGEMLETVVAECANQGLVQLAP